MCRQLDDVIRRRDVARVGMSSARRRNTKKKNAPQVSTPLNSQKSGDTAQGACGAGRPSMFVCRVVVGMMQNRGTLRKSVMSYRGDMTRMS